MDLLSSAISRVNDTAKPTLTFRSQVSPEVQVDFQQPDAPPPPAQKGPGGALVDFVLANVIRPEVEVDIGGVKRSYAPYGKPQGNFGPLVGLGALALLGVSGYVAWRTYKYCRKKLK